MVHLDLHSASNTTWGSGIKPVGVDNLPKRPKPKPVTSYAKNRFFSVSNHRIDTGLASTPIVFALTASVLLLARE